jgi:sugar phosphate isomerase/epimerase
MGGAASASRKRIRLQHRNWSEAAKTLAGVPSRHFMLNWDPGNAAKRGQVPYPDAYNLLPKDRIGHCHVKDVARTDKDYEWAEMGKGIVDWAGQFGALKRDGYHYAVNLKTHRRGAGTRSIVDRVLARNARRAGKSWGLSKLVEIIAANGRTAGGGCPHISNLQQSPAAIV